MLNPTAADVGKAIRENLRAERERIGLSQADLAKRAKLKPAAISHFEIGTRKPSALNIVRLCLALGMSADRLLGIRP